ncbi:MULTISPECIES: hypothetical protein [Cysteiniphilum]|uniref:Uncharacterized protein n=1 Tax=Cysteiniphilum litorale TaxID=2056700 RepID=A0A8J2Z781_9GAMM|nr:MULTISPECIES: hypothetical protein [Cysteiniphilum]GGG08891.1 hypothetical protein GCM10010995_28090 [Cysteiniphilum litorale]
MFTIILILVILTTILALWGIIRHGTIILTPLPIILLSFLCYSLFQDNSSLVFKSIPKVSLSLTQSSSVENSHFSASLKSKKPLTEQEIQNTIQNSASKKLSFLTVLLTTITVTKMTNKKIGNEYVYDINAEALLTNNPLILLFLLSLVFIIMFYQILRIFR